MFNTDMMKKSRNVGMTSSADDCEKLASLRFGFMDEAPHPNPVAFRCGDNKYGISMCILSLPAILLMIIVVFVGGILTMHTSVFIGFIIASLVGFLCIVMLCSCGIPYKTENDDMNRIRIRDNSAIMGRYGDYAYVWLKKLPKGIRQLSRIVDKARSKCDINFFYLCEKLHDCDIAKTIMKAWRKGDIAFDHPLILQCVDKLGSIIDGALLSDEFKSYSEVSSSELSKEINEWIDGMKRRNDCQDREEVSICDSIASDVEKIHELQSTMQLLAGHGFIGISQGKSIRHHAEYSPIERNMLIRCRVIGILKLLTIISAISASVSYVMIIHSYLEWVRTSIYSFMNSFSVFMVNAVILTWFLVTFLVGIIHLLPFRIPMFIELLDHYDIFESDRFFNNYDSGITDSLWTVSGMDSVDFDAAIKKASVLPYLDYGEFKRKMEIFTYALFSVDFIMKSHPAGHLDEYTKRRLRKVFEVLSPIGDKKNT